MANYCNNSGVENKMYWDFNMSIIQMIYNYKDCWVIKAMKWCHMYLKNECSIVFGKNSSTKVAKGTAYYYDTYIPEAKSSMKKIWSSSSEFSFKDQEFLYKISF